MKQPANQAHTGAILRCDGEGRIASVGNLGLLDDGTALVGRSFGSLFREASRDDALAALAMLRRAGKGLTAMRVELDVAVNDGDGEICMAGYAVPGGAAFLLAPSADALFDICVAFDRGDGGPDADAGPEDSEEPDGDEAELLRELSALNNELANAKRELALKNLTLERVNARLGSLNAEKDKFFSIIGHELKSPFNALLGYAALLEEEASAMPGSEVTEVAGAIHRSGREAFRLLENLLDWAQLQMGSMEPKPRTFPLSSVVRHSLSSLAPAAERKEIRLACEIGDESVLADREMVETVIRNLVNNAIKFTPRGGNVAVRSGRIGDCVTVAVSDTGVGIPASRLEGIFAMGEGKSSVGTEGETGTGLGLLLCKELAERNGGEFAVSSAEGEGTTFSFTLPTGKGEDSAR